VFTARTLGHRTNSAATRDQTTDARHTALISQFLL
jgi:hypothetical protein